MSLKARSQVLEIASVREFDAIIIGGGIAGAGVAQDLASRDLSVLLIEKDDFASGASSRSSKILHGGLSFLENLRFGLARETCKERALIEQLAPHRVRDLSFILPLFRTERVRKLKAGLGFNALDLLSWNIGSEARHTRISQKAVTEHVPGLHPDNITGGIRFQDCVTDDSRLVIEVVKSAAANGALAINYMQVTGFDLQDGVVRTVNCRDRYSGTDLSFRCKTCINASGVWTDRIAAMIDRQSMASANLEKGVHIMVPNSAFETNSAVVLPGPAKREFVFVLPWQRALLIGTTYNAYQGEPEHIIPETDEIDWLLAAVNRFCIAPLRRRDVIAAWAGLSGPTAGSRIGMGNGRNETANNVSSNNLSTDNVSTNNVLATNTAVATGKSAEPVSGKRASIGAGRDGEVLPGPGGTVAITGVNLTNYRRMAGRAGDKVVQRLSESSCSSSEMPRSARESRTDRMMLGGWADKNDFLTVTAAVAAQARKQGIDPATLDHLIASYGSDAQAIVDLVEREPSLGNRVCPDFPPIMAEVAFCVVTEMAVSLEDLLFRRMRLAMVHQKQCLEAAPKVAMLIQTLLGWDNARTELELSTVEHNLDEHMRSYAEAALETSAPRGEVEINE